MKKYFIQGVAISSPTRLAGQANRKVGEYSEYQGCSNGEGHAQDEGWQRVGEGVKEEQALLLPEDGQVVDLQGHMTACSAKRHTAKQVMPRAPTNNIEQTERVTAGQAGTWVAGARVWGGEIQRQRRRSLQCMLPVQKTPEHPLFR